MSDDLERQNSRLRAQGENERAPYLNGCVHRPVVGTASGSHALGARELPEGYTDSDVQELLALQADSCARNWWPQGDSNPRFSLERAVT